MVVVSHTRAVLHYARAPRSSGSDPAVGAVMLSASEWVISGTRAEGRGGRLGAVIQRTVDGGRTWSTAFSAPLDSLWWLGQDGSSLVAAGESFRYARSGIDAGTEVDQRPLLLRSDDGGATWSVARPLVRYDEWESAEQLFFSGDGVALAVASADQSSPLFSNEFPPGVLRSGDDGRSWHVVPLPGRGVAYGSASWTPGGQTVFVTGLPASNTTHCPDRLWRSEDAGASWQLVRGACKASFDTVTFLDPLNGFLAGGGDPKFSSGQFVLATDDGGARWRRLWRDTAQYGESELVQLDFVDPEHGWAVPGGITSGANTGYLGDALATDDGGGHWRDTGQLATGLSALPGGYALAYAANPKAAPELALTRDGGETWTELMPLSQVESYGLLGAQGWVTDLTSAGDFLSTDGGTHWRALDPPMFDVHAESLAIQPGVLATLDTSGDRCALRLSQNLGTSWRAVAPPAGNLRRILMPGGGGGGVISCREQESIAFADRGHGFAVPYGALCGTPGTSFGGAQADTVYTTSDGGLRWRRRRLIPVLAGSDSSVVSASGSTYVIVGAANGGGPDSANCAQVAISRDRGRTWSVQALPSGEECDGAAARGREIWLTCDNDLSLDAQVIRGTVYRSTDAGRTWHAFTGPAAFATSQIVATGSGRAIASDADPSQDSTAGAALWETRDGGATWTHAWPALPIGPSHPPTRRRGD